MGVRHLGQLRRLVVKGHLGQSLRPNHPHPMPLALDPMSLRLEVLPILVAQPLVERLSLLLSSGLRVLVLLQLLFLLFQLLLLLLLLLFYGILWVLRLFAR